MAIKAAKINLADDPAAGAVEREPRPPGADRGSDAWRE
jgi:hypothetical protein